MLEHDDVIDTVEELGRECFVECLADDGLLGCRLGLGVAGGEAYAGAEILELAGTDVGGHDDYGVLEVDAASHAVGEAAFVKHLKEEVEHIGVGLFDFVEENHGVGTAAHLLGELAAFVITDISRRRADEARHSEFLHVFAHVDAYERFG